MTSRRTWRSDTIYLSGPMTGLPDLNRPAFAEASARLRAAGWHVVNPAELDRMKPRSVVEGAEWEGHLRHDLAALCLRCTAITTLPGWERSRGANLEVLVANRLGLPHLDLAEAIASGPRRAA